MSPVLNEASVSFKGKKRLFIVLENGFNVVGIDGMIGEVISPVIE